MHPFQLLEKMSDVLITAEKKSYYVCRRKK